MRRKAARAGGIRAVTDESLLARYAARGSQAVFGELFARHGDWLTRRLVSSYRFDHATADNVAQETWIAVASDCRRLWGGSFPAWLWAIARGRAANYLRKVASRDRLHDHSQPDCLDALPSEREDFNRAVRAQADACEIIAARIDGMCGLGGAEVPKSIPSPK